MAVRMEPLLVKIERKAFLQFKILIMASPRLRVITPARLPIPVLPVLVLLMISLWVLVRPRCSWSYWVLK